MTIPRQRAVPYRRILAVLVGVSVIAILLPQPWLGTLISAVQIFIPFQHAAQSGVDAVSDAVSTSAPTVSGASYDELNRAKQAADNHVASLTLRIQELEREVDLLTATRLWQADGGAIGTQGRLIPVRVLSDDIVPWRSSRLLTAGSVQGVETCAPVLSDYFSISGGSENGVSQGQAILLGESLIGVVARAGTHTSRVQLLSDPDVQLKVRIGRHENGAFHVVDGLFWLVGRGGGSMEILDAKRHDVDGGRLKIGDLVLSDPASTDLPSAMVIGTVSDIMIDPRKPLFATLNVSAAVDPSDLRRVYVFDRNEAAALPP